MKVLLNRLLLFICVSSTSVLTTCILTYYLKEPMIVQIINPSLGGYQFTLWLLYIPNLIALYYILKEVTNE